MNGRYEGWVENPTSPLTEGLAAIRQLTAVRPVRLLMGYTPVARSNPFQTQLYREFPSYGIAPTPIIRSVDWHELVNLREIGVDVAVHFHWLNVVLQQADSLTTAHSMLDEFLTNLTTYRERRGKLIWTVHNRLPHDTIYPELEIRLRQEVANAADLIHVMSPATRHSLLPDIDLPQSKTVTVSHPHYRSAYADSMSRYDARLALGIEAHEVVYLLFGAIKAYKGLDELLSAFQALATREKEVRLVVAGKPDSDPETRRFVEACRQADNILIHPRRIPAEEAQIFLRAADVGVAPYRRVLNSGAVILYQTFGLPVVVPNEPSLLEDLLDGGIETYEEGGLQTAMRSIMHQYGSEEYRVKDSFFNRRAPQRISDKLAREIVERL